MHYIVYGRNKVEETVFNSAKLGFSKDEIIYISDDKSLTESLEIVKYKPFFNDRWFLVINIDKLSNKGFLTALKLLNNDKVKIFMRIDRKRDIFSSIRKSKTLNSMEGLTILNAKYPSEEFIGNTLLERVHKRFSDTVIRYVANNIRFNIEKLDEVIDRMNDFELDEITLQDIKRILPQSKTKDLKSVCYSLLLCNREDLKKHWRDSKAKVLVGNAGTKIKPYQILNEIEMQPEFLLDLIIKIFKDMIKVKKLYIQGILTETNIFKGKEKFENKYPFMKALSIPVIIEYIVVSREVTLQDLNFCLNEFLFIKQKKEPTLDDIYLSVYKIMNRFKENNLREEH